MRRITALGRATALFLLTAACAPAADTHEPHAATVPAHLSQALPVEGVASWYGPGFIGRLTANGEVYTAREMTAAHRTLAFNTLVRVTNLENGRSAVIRINDRGPFVGERVIDLSEAAAERLGMIGPGTSRVRLELEPPRSLDATLLARTDRHLAGFDAVSRHHALGELVFLTSAGAPHPVLVRVVDDDPARYGDADLLLSPQAYALLGGAVRVLPSGR
jgi:rare lipoprotein A